MPFSPSPRHTGRTSRRERRETHASGAVPRRPTRLQAEARGAVSVPGLRQRRCAAALLRGGGGDQPAYRGRALPRRRPGRPPPGRQPRPRRRRRAGGLARRDAALRRKRAVRPARRLRPPRPPHRRRPRRCHRQLPCRGRAQAAGRRRRRHGGDPRGQHPLLSGQRPFRPRARYHRPADGGLATGAAGSRPVLDRRRAAGFVRHCHGDLHLRNIVLHDGRAMLFDAIEFDAAYADIDVLYDLAFLVMDLEFRDLRRLASILLNRYLDVTGDSGGLAALPLFLSMRAAIRSHIDAAAAATHSDVDAAAGLAAGASRYLKLGLSFLAPAAPRLIAVGGLSGSGKSRLARELAPSLAPPPGARVIRSDATRKRLAGVAPETRLPLAPTARQPADRPTPLSRAEAREVLAAGRPVIADAVFARPEERAAIAAVAAEAGVPFQGLWLAAAPDLLQERVEKRLGNASDATPEVVRQQLADDLGPIDWPRVDSVGRGCRDPGGCPGAAWTANLYSW
ncbi:MAG: AAA family ATPase [Rhodospirillales bacterium]